MVSLPVFLSQTVILNNSLLDLLVLMGRHYPAGVAEGTRRSEPKTEKVLPDTGDTAGNGEHELEEISFPDMICNMHENPLRSRYFFPKGLQLMEEEGKSVRRKEKQRGAAMD